MKNVVLAMLLAVFLVSSAKAVPHEDLVLVEVVKLIRNNHFDAYPEFLVSNVEPKLTRKLEVIRRTTLDGTPLPENVREEFRTILYERSPKTWSQEAVTSLNFGTSPLCASLLAVSRPFMSPHNKKCFSLVVLSQKDGGIRRVSVLEYSEGNMKAGTLKHVFLPSGVSLPADGNVDSEYLKDEVPLRQ